MKIRWISLLVVVGLFSGLCIDAAAQNNEYINYTLAYGGRTTLKKAIAELVSGDEDRSYDVDGTRFLVYAKITRAERPMSDETRAALSLWKSMSEAERNLDVSRDEVEVMYGDATLWMPVSRLEKMDMFRETQPGGGVYLLIRAIGRRENTPILFIEYYINVANMGLDSVLLGAVECATKLNDFAEGLDILEEAAQRWSLTADWNEDKHSAALSYIRGLAYWDGGEYELAEKYLEPAKRYIKSWPNDDVSCAMTAGLEAMGKEELK